MLHKIITYNFLIFSYISLFAMPLIAMDQHAICHDLTDLVQIDISNNKEFISQRNLVNKYKKYRTIDGKPLYQPYTWTCFGELPISGQLNIVKDYYDVITYSLLQETIGQAFVLHFKNYYKTRTDNYYTDFEILRPKIQDVLFIKQLYQIITPDVINIIWTHLNQKFIEYIEDIWSKQLKETDLGSDINVDFTTTSTQRAFNNRESFFDQIFLNKYSIEPFFNINNQETNINGIKIVSPQGTKICINIPKMNFYKVSTLCIHESLFGYIKGHKNPTFSVYDIKTGHKLFFECLNYKPIKACDMAHGLIGLLVGTNYGAFGSGFQKVVILSTLTNRAIFQSAQYGKIIDMDSNKSSKFRLAIQTKEGNVVLGGDNITSLTSPFNPFETLIRLQNNEKISLLEFITARYAADRI